MIGLVRKAKHKVRGSGFVVTWDVDSDNHATANRLWAFLFGRTVRIRDREYRYEGFVWRDGVRYMGQSIVFVLTHRLAELAGFLASHGIDHEIDANVFPEHDRYSAASGASRDDPQRRSITAFLGILPQNDIDAS